jgi:malonyl CoA-acyl carrier protein transacylase
MSIIRQAPVAPVRLNPDVPEELERIINKCLEKDRSLRYQHAKEIRADLKRVKRDSSLQKTVIAAEHDEDENEAPSALISEDLASIIASGVRWYDATTVLEELGFRLFLEMPPAHVLQSPRRGGLPRHKNCGGRRGVA